MGKRPNPIRTADFLTASSTAVPPGDDNKSRCDLLWFYRNQTTIAIDSKCLPD